MSRRPFLLASLLVLVLLAALAAWLARERTAEPQSAVAGETEREVPVAESTEPAPAEDLARAALDGRALPTLAVRVVSTVDGRPVAAGEVAAGRAGAERRVHALAGGACAIELAPELDALELTATAPGHFGERLRVGASVLRAPEPAVEIALRPSVALTVEVVDEDGAPVAARIRVDPAELAATGLRPALWPLLVPPSYPPEDVEHDGPVLGDVTDARGELVVPGLPADTELLVRANGQPVRHRTAARGTLDRVRVVVPRPRGVVRGHVAWSDGTPASSLTGLERVELVSAARTHRASTQGDGDFRFHPVGPGEWTLRFGVVGAEDVSVRVGGADTDLGHFVLARPLELAGRVVAAGCARAARPRLELVWPGAPEAVLADVDASGAFRATVGAPRGTVRALCGEHVLAEVAFEAPRTDLEIELGGATLALEGLPPGLEVELFLLDAARPHDAPAIGLGAFSAESNGRLELCGAPAGAWSLLVTAPERGAAWVRELELSHGERATVLVPPLGSGELRVAAAGPVPSAGSLAAARSVGAPTAARSSRAELDAARSAMAGAPAGGGACAPEPSIARSPVGSRRELGEHATVLPCGPWRVHAGRAPAGGVAETVDVVVEYGELLEMPVTPAAPVGRVEVVATVGGRALAGAATYLDALVAGYDYSAKPAARRAATDAAGGVSHDCVLTGRWAVGVEHAGTWLRVETSIASGETTRVAVELPEVACVVRLAGDPALLARVRSARAVSLDGTVTLAETAFGTWSGHVPRGRYALRLALDELASGRSLVTAACELAPGADVAVALPDEWLRVRLAEPGRLAPPGVAVVAVEGIVMTLDGSVRPRVPVELGADGVLRAGPLPESARVSLVGRDSDHVLRERTLEPGERDALWP